MPTENKQDNPGAAKLPTAPALVYGSVSLDLLKRKVTIGGEQYALSPKEFSMLYLLIWRAGASVSNDELCDAIGSANDNEALQSQLYRLRKKLAGSGYRIANNRGRGYRLEREDD